MVTTQFPKTAFQKQAFIILVIFFVLWTAGQVVSQDGFWSNQGELYSASAVVERSASNEPVAEAIASHYLTQPAASRTEEAQNWFIVDEESQWSDQERAEVEQIMDRTWAALESTGLDGQRLLTGYRFRRLAGEFIPGDVRLLAVVNHEAKEIVLADGAFKRLHGFYIYHELGHAVDQRLGRLPSEAYHRIANVGQDESIRDNDTWSTVTGFWLRYHGRDDREEATADAFAWWVMEQANQPKPYFPGTPVTTDYEDIAQAIEAALVEAGSATNLTS